MVSSRWKEGLPRRVASGLLVGVAYGVIYFLILSSVESLLPPGQPSPLSNLGLLFGVIIGLSVVSKVASGSIFEFFFSGGKSVVLIGYLIFALDGGVITGEFPVEGQVISVVINGSVLLAVAVSAELVSLAKAVIQAIGFLEERA